MENEQKNPTPSPDGSIPLVGCRLKPSTFTGPFGWDDLVIVAPNGDAVATVDREWMATRDIPTPPMPRRWEGVGEEQAREMWVKLSQLIAEWDAEDRATAQPVDEVILGGDSE